MINYNNIQKTIQYNIGISNNAKYSVIRYVNIIYIIRIWYTIPYYNTILKEKYNNIVENKQDTTI